MRQARIKRFNALDYTGTEAIDSICTNLSFFRRDCNGSLSPALCPWRGQDVHVSGTFCTTWLNAAKRVLMIDADLRRSSVVSKPRLETEGRCTVLRIIWPGIASWAISNT